MRKHVKNVTAVGIQNVNFGKLGKSDTSEYSENSENQKYRRIGKPEKSGNQSIKFSESLIIRLSEYSEFSENSRFMSIYTRTGDFGETSLFGGKRVLKCDDVVEVYGLIDELNSSIGLVISKMETIEVQSFLQEVQKDLFSMGSFFAGSPSDLTFIEKRVKELEARIDTMEHSLTPIHQFILPGGSVRASLIHLTRSIGRRVERKAVYILKICPDHPEIQKKHVEKIIPYLNRLSDFLFVLARFVNKQENIMEIVWDGTK